MSVSLIPDEMTQLHRACDRVRLANRDSESKVLPLPEAIRRFLRPGMTIYVREGSYAGLREIIRQFWGTSPGFTLVIVGCRDYALDFMHCGLAARLITSRCSDSATQGISPVVKRVSRQKSVAIENWSLYSLALRMMAGAMGVGFLPTRSLVGSSMAQENEGSFTEIVDPFDGSDRLGLVRGLNPDVAIVHGWAADPSGNLIVAPTLLSGEGEWGAFASREGIVATVERLVSSEFIREHNSLVAIPGHFVRSISVVPYGAHPLGMPAQSECFGEYEPDYDFMEEHAQATLEAESSDAWLKEWVLDCPDNDDYLRKLGWARLAFLSGKAGRFDWRYKLLSNPPQGLAAQDYTTTEQMIIAASRLISDKVIQSGYQVILAGIGTAGLAAWLAHYRLREQSVEAELMVGSSIFGWEPRPGDPQVTSFSSLHCSKMVTDVLHTYGVFANRRCLAVLGTAQIDRYGNLNSTRVSGDSYLTGSGGANDAVATAEETIVVAPLSRRRFVPEVPYVTCPGSKIRAVVSEKAVLEKVDWSDELVMTAYVGDGTTDSREDAIRTTREGCGWELKIYPELKVVPAPTSDELELLRLLSSSPKPHNWSSLVAAESLP